MEFVFPQPSSNPRHLRCLRSLLAFHPAQWEPCRGFMNPKLINARSRRVPGPATSRPDLSGLRSRTMPFPHCFLPFYVLPIPVAVPVNPPLNLFPPHRMTGS